MPREVTFFSQAADRLQHACRWTRRALQEGAKVVVTGPGSTLIDFDRRLWIFDAGSFVPHARATRYAELPPRLAETPVLLLEHLDGAPSEGAILLNLGADVPPALDRFERIVEVVSQDPEDRTQARVRWRHYESAGLAPRNHALAA